jgi:cell division protease FtsH
MVMQKEEKELTAYHESGHAIVAINASHSDPIHKATIIPRGRALGLVMRLPEKDRFSVTRAKLLDDLAVAMGGRAAEELIFGYDKVTTGASSDIEQATAMAKSMVTKWGLSDKVGEVFYGNNDNHKGYYGAAENEFSPETAKIIDEETKRIVTEAIARARKILTEKRDDLEKLARALLEYETLTGDEISDLLAGRPIKRSKDAGKKTLKSSIPSFNEGAPGAEVS